MSATRPISTLNDHPAVASEFRVDVEPDRDVVRVCPSGEVDLGTVGVIRAQVEELLSIGFEHVVVDLRGATFLDSTGLRLMIELNACSRADGWTFAMIEGPAPVQRAFELTGLRQHLPFIDGGELAIRRWRRTWQ